MTTHADLITPRLQLRDFTTDDIAAMEGLLSDPHIAICIMCDSSTPEKSQNAARRRIDWFNSYWNSGYGVRAITIRDPELGTPEDVIGWCGVAGYGGSQGEPEILYGLHRDHWGKGIATEAGRAAIEDFFSSTDETGVCAIIFEQLNANSVPVAERLGLTLRRRVAFADFSPGVELRQQTLDYALWCIGSSHAREDHRLLVSAAAKAGLLVGSGVGDASEVRTLLRRQSVHADHQQAAEAAFNRTREDPTCPYLALSRA